MTRFYIRIGLALGLLPGFLCVSSGAGRNPGMLTYRGGGKGKVVFDHQLHVAKAFTCNDCHRIFPPTGTQLFQMQKKGFISTSDHGSQEKCFACHDGQLAFNDCNQCHRKVGGF